MGELTCHCSFLSSIQRQASGQGQNQRCGSGVSQIRIIEQEEEENRRMSWCLRHYWLKMEVQDRNHVDDGACCCCCLKEDKGAVEAGTLAYSCIFWVCGRCCMLGACRCALEGDQETYDERDRANERHDIEAAARAQMI